MPIFAFVDQTLRYSNFRYHHYLDLRCSIEVSPLPIFGVGQEARFGVGANVLPSNILADGGSTLFLVPLPDTGPGNPLFLARTQTLDWFLLRRI